MANRIDKLKRDESGKFSTVDNPGSKAGSPAQQRKPRIGIIASVKEQSGKCIYILKDGYSWIGNKGKYKVGDKVQVIPALKGIVQVRKV